MNTRDFFGIDYNICINEVLESVDFDKVSDLSKEDFAKVLSEVFSQVFNSSAFQNKVYETVVEENKRMIVRSNGRGGI